MSGEHSGTPIVTAAPDSRTVYVGDRVYCYYSMKPCIIAEEPKSDGWFHVRYDDGGRDLLNGERICSLGYAQRRGFPDAE